MIEVKYDEFGGIANCDENHGSLSGPMATNNRRGYNILERLLLKYDRKINYIFDSAGLYKCRREGLPHILRLEPTNRCTARCSYCPRAVVNDVGTGYMDFSLYKKIIDWAVGHKIGKVGFALWGEPLIHPQIIEMIDYAHERGLSVRFSTNAIAFSEVLAKKILSYPIEAIEISLDGTDEHEYVLGKQVNQFQKATDNVLNLIKLAKEKKSQTVFNIHFVNIGNVSWQNTIKYMKFWKNQFQGLNFKSSFVYDPHNWAGTMPVERYLSWFDRLLMKFEVKKPCPYLAGLVINWNGNVCVCTNNPRKQALIGNVSDQSIEKMYSGEKRMKYLVENERGTFKDVDCLVCSVNTIWPLLFLKKRIGKLISSIF